MMVSGHSMIIKKWYEKALNIPIYMHVNEIGVWLGAVT